MLKKSSYPHKSTSDGLSRQTLAMYSFENLLETTSVIKVTANLTPRWVAGYITTFLLEKYDNASQSSRPAAFKFAKLFKDEITRSYSKKTKLLRMP